MFDTLSEKFQDLFASFAGKKRLSEENMAAAVREVRVALLEADVQYGVVKTFVSRVKEKALGSEVLKSVKPGELFIKLVHDELAKLMGGEEEPLRLKGKPSRILMAGLQGTGKTTQSAKLAYYLKRKGEVKAPLLVACDLQRPAAREQLQVLGKQAGVAVFVAEGETNPVRAAKAGLEFAKKNGFDLAIFDTAGRLHVDEALMQEVQAIRDVVTPDEILFVANAATGQDAVQTAKAFNEVLEISGTILTMLDGDTRGGAAISIREVTGKPLKFEGVGERLDDLQPFSPESMADRVLGMGDTINLVRKAQEHIDEDEAKKLEEKVRKATFSYEDYLKQMQAFRKMGSMKGLMKMLPGASKLPDLDQSDQEFGKMEAMILSMTPQERREEVPLSTSRAKRIAKGSGTSVGEVQRLRKSFTQTKGLFKNKKGLKKLSKMKSRFGGF